MGKTADMKLDEIVNIISAEQKEATEACEEKKAGFSSDEIEYLKSKEELRQAKLQNDILAETLEKLRQDRDERKDYASMIFNLMCWYLFAVFFIIILNGITANNFLVSDNVIMALLGTTAIEVIGTFGFVAKYLFEYKKGEP